MTIEVKVVTKPGEGFWSSLFLQTGNFPLYLDQYLKGADPILTVRELVTKVIDKSISAGTTVDYVQINGHGNATGFDIGNEWIDLKTLPNFRQELAKMAPHLSKNSGIEISACKAGAAKELMRQFSSILNGVSIIGFILPQSGGMSDNGPRVIVTPGGSYSPPKLASGVNPPSPPPPE